MANAAAWPALMIWSSIERRAKQSLPMTAMISTTGASLHMVDIAIVSSCVMSLP